MWLMPLLPWSIPVTGETRFNEANVKKTYDQIARFSKKDAETYLDLTEKYKDKWRAAFHKHRYSPPTPYGVPDALEELCNDPTERPGCTYAVHDL